MSRFQLSLLVFSVLLFNIIYLGLDVKPKKFADIEQSRVGASEKTGIQNLIADVQKQLTTEQQALLMSLEDALGETSSDSLKTILLKQISGKWYEFGQTHIAGFYAERVAELEKSATAWSIAGTTFAATFQKPVEEKVKSYAFDKATSAFEKAISFDPNAMEPKINLALCYVENPPKDMPMKGIMMLLDLNKQYPEDVSVLVNLGRLGLRTGQHEKAIERLEKALRLAPENNAANCLLVQAYTAINQADKAALYQKKCQ